MTMMQVSSATCDPVPYDPQDKFAPEPARLLSHSVLRGSRSTASPLRTSSTAPADTKQPEVVDL